MQDVIQTLSNQVIETNIHALRDMLNVTAYRAKEAYEEIALRSDVRAAIGNLISMQEQLEDIQALIETVMTLQRSRACWVKA